MQQPAERTHIERHSIDEEILLLRGVFIWGAARFKGEVRRQKIVLLLYVLSTIFLSAH
jgi:hypothetical protein